ncbi:hypothetical protein FANTH_12220 [Fusarium anthophilum]|uniref:Fe2OG dioxygenase domain-containing protein n=1 Tax=Fusarium anthophilum TaxID=48485 RepID=A0A8H4YU86_9HYPO|nr:hypothetical protein FANTH_12220 [Fusarium anthophilum]
MLLSISKLICYTVVLIVGPALAWLLQADLVGKTSRLLSRTTATQAHKYEVQIFSRDPLILHISGFMSDSEIEHVLKITDGKWKTSKIYPNGEAYVDTDIRISEMAPVPRKDPVTRGIVRRAKTLQGWRGNGTFIEQMKAQRYSVNGFFAWHEDYDGRMNIGNRVSTFMVYLNDDFTGGGTNFPVIQRPADKRWCGVVECEDTEYPGVTFKPIKGSAVFWENMYPNGSFHPDVRHASLPVTSGEKLGLNIFGWDKNWILPP